MIAKILLLCGTIGLAQSDVDSRYPEHHGHKPWPEGHGMPTNSQPSSLLEEYWGTEFGREETPNQAPTTLTELGDYNTGNHKSRNGNWCSSIRSRLITYIAACKTEKYIIKSQQPCPNGTPDCQKIMYRTALKPVYKVKQKVGSSLYWKCCPGYSGKNCEHHEPNFLLVPTDHPGGWEEESEAFSSQREIIETHQSHEAQLEDLQNDVQQVTNHLGILQKALHHNISSTRGEAKHNQSEVQEQFLQQMLFPHMENFLRKHFQPVWASLNKSLQDLSTGLKNLSQNVEANRRSIERFQETTVPKKDFQELGTKFESKVQTNIWRVDQMKREIEDHFHQQQAAIHYNLTMIKADTDIKLKRNHKIQISYLLALNNSLTGMRQEQDKLQGELEALSRNLVFPIQLGSQNEAFDEVDIQILNQSLAKHAKQLKELYEQSEEDYQELNQSINGLKASSKQDIEELRIDLMEKSLIIEEYREGLERKILALNNTLTNIEESQWDLERSLKACHCENLPLSISAEDQENITQIYREEMKQLEARLKDLAAAFPLIYQSLDFQQEQNRKLEDGMSFLKSHADTLSEDMTTLKKTDEKMHGHIKYLNSSFNSLLVDAMRHEKALVAMLGDEILEALSEDDPGSFLLPPDHLQVMNIEMISDHLKKQNLTLESVMNRILSLEIDSKNNLNAHKSLKNPVLEKQIEDMEQVVNTQQGRVEYMEPNHEAAMEEAPVYQDIMILKKEIGHLNKEMKGYRLQWDRAHLCCNQTRVNLVEPLSISVENLREDLASTQQSMEEHLQIVQKLFGSYKELVAANVSLDVAKIQSLMGRKMRKQLKVHEQQKMRDKKKATDIKEGTLNGRNKIHTEILETGTEVAFYVRYPEGREQRPSLNGTYLNYGKGFFPEHGYFKSPHSGVYMVAISVELPPEPALGQLVFSNGERLILTENKRRKANGASMTTFALVELLKGERMWFELVQDAAVKWNPAGLSMAGFLIFKT
ncbi:multimerin-2 [Sceloporus undulatus]|uniref:multimerin-2 n=1 Tax=Sceloporus undulatus TaxID=8520 RepID=UPI001C4B32FF|nr:multimerin-2 [Sceloporus undulatus]